MATRNKRPVTTPSHLSSTGGGGSGPSSIENEIERSRELERWERVIEKSDYLRQKSDKHYSVLADFLVGEAKLEEYIKAYPTPNVPRRNLSTTGAAGALNADELINDARSALLKAIGDDGKKLGVHLDSFILLGKLHYTQGEYTEALQYYEKAQIEALEEKQLPPRSLKIMAEAFAIKAVCMEKSQPSMTTASKPKIAERENNIIRCFEIASDLTLLYLQVADRAINANAGQSAGQSTWSVASAGTTGSTSPVQPASSTLPMGSVATSSASAAAAESDGNLMRPKMGLILECALYRAAVLNINQGKPMKAVTRLRSMLMAEETESTQEIRQNVCCQLAEVLVSNCSNMKYIHQIVLGCDHCMSYRLDDIRRMHLKHHNHVCKTSDTQSMKIRSSSGPMYMCPH